MNYFGDCETIPGGDTEIAIDEKFEEGLASSDLTNKLSNTTRAIGSKIESSLGRILREIKTDAGWIIVQATDRHETSLSEGETITYKIGDRVFNNAEDYIRELKENLMQ